MAKIECPFVKSASPFSMASAFLFALSRRSWLLIAAGQIDAEPLLLPLVLFATIAVRLPLSSDESELTEESLAAFVASWDSGELETKEFNLPTKGEDGEVEGGSE